MKYTKRETNILKRAYIDYKQLKEKLDIDLENTNDMEKCYEYIKNLAKNNKTITFTNVDLDLGYFDFNYNDMLLTISKYNINEICKLSEQIVIYDDENSIDLCEIDFKDLEKIILKVA